jgi:hypothetical protein
LQYLLLGSGGVDARHHDRDPRSFKISKLWEQLAGSEEILPELARRALGDRASLESCVWVDQSCHLYILIPSLSLEELPCALGLGYRYTGPQAAERQPCRCEACIEYIWSTWTGLITGAVRRRMRIKARRLGIKTTPILLLLQERQLTNP